VKLSLTVAREMKIATSDSFRQIVVIAAITFAGSCLMPNALGQQQAGYVLEINGQWVLSGHGQLAQGQSVPAGGVVNAQSAAADDRIVIVNRNGEIVARRHCRNSGECARPIKLPMPVSESSTLSIFVSSVMSLLSGEPDRYSIHRKRDEDFPDAVVKLDGQQLDLTPIFKMKGPRNFYVRLRAIRRQAEPAAKWIGPITLAWNPDRPAIAKLPDAQPASTNLHCWNAMVTIICRPAPLRGCYSLRPRHIARLPRPIYRHSP